MEYFKYFIWKEFFLRKYLNSKMNKENFISKTKLPSLLIIIIIVLTNTINGNNVQNSNEITTNSKLLPLASNEDVQAQKNLIIDNNEKSFFNSSEPKKSVDNNNNNNKTIKDDNKQNKKNCQDDNYCLNGGTCVLTETGQMLCLCPESFYGSRCQTRNICKSIIWDSLTGDQICSKIGSDCMKNDKFLRCICKTDEYFVFKTNQQPIITTEQQHQSLLNNGNSKSFPSSSSSSVTADAKSSRETPTTTTTIQHSSSTSNLSLLKENTDSKQQQQEERSELKLVAREITNNDSNHQQTYIAECRKIDKCLGLRCKQLSEVCKDGECVCNQDAGYMRDPFDNNICKLLDPCKMPTEDGKPICGQAQCIATYDSELYKCICPLGYQALRVSSHRNSTVCTILRNLICRVPLLNKCQHICEIDNANNNYKCSCLRGYRPGTRPGIDDHMCFFIKQVDDPYTNGYDDYTNTSQDYYTSDVIGSESGRSSTSSNNNLDDDDDEYEFKAYTIPRSLSSTPQPNGGGKQQLADTFTYDPLTTTSATTTNTSNSDNNNGQAANSTTFADSLSLEDFEPEDIIPQRFKSDEIYIKREKRNKNSKRNDTPNKNKIFGNNEEDDDIVEDLDFDGRQATSNNNKINHHHVKTSDHQHELPRLTAQERCNMYCEENKICELEDGSTDSYRCVCNRQGYVSIGDRCLDWCAAADFEWQLRGLLDYTCWSGTCKQSNQHPILTYAAKLAAGELANGKASEEDEFSKLERESSWRPTFECDCSNSPLLVQDPKTKLCKFNFEAALEPCKPGNVGYIDCVENKNAYCAVLYKQHKQFVSEHQRERFYKSIKTMAAQQQTSKAPPGGGPSSPVVGPSSSSSADFATTTTSKENSKDYLNKKQANNHHINKLGNEKMYTCLCSPEKKFLVDKPRNKQRCVDECDLLNVECGRFNRMCRSATIAPDDFGKRNLVRFGPDGARMNFKRTGCECLPGFNVGPSESVDFTIDDNPSTANNNNNQFIDSNNQDQQFIEDNLIPINNNEVNNINFDQDPSEKARAKYININSRCLLDYDVVEFHASFKLPFDFDPNWIKINNNVPLQTIKSSPSSSFKNNNNDQVLSPSKSPTGSGISKENEERQKEKEEEATNNRQQSETLKIPDFMFTDINELHKKVVLVAQCDPSLMPISIEAFQECVKYRYWIVQKLRNHFVDWRRVITAHLKDTFDLMEGNVRLRVNKCNATLKSVLVHEDSSFGSEQNRSNSPSGSDNQQQTLVDNNQSSDNNNNKSQPSTSGPLTQHSSKYFNLLNQQTVVDGLVNCELTLHSASDDFSPRYARKVLLEKQLHKFIFPVMSLEELQQQQSQAQENSIIDNNNNNKEKKIVYGMSLANINDYYLMAPHMLIKRESFDQLAKHRKEFNPCKSDYAYCEKQTRCEMVDTVNFTCTCEYGYTPIGSRDIYYADSRKEVCEDINECLFDVCKKLANVSTCINEIGDYRCQCNRHYIGDNKRYCNHVCSTISCKHGKCRLVDDHHAYCECDEGYKDTDCSVQDPNVALRKANMIICGSIFTSVLLLAITFAISLSSQLRKTKKKLKRLEAANEAVSAGGLFELSNQQPLRPRLSFLYLILLF